MKQLEKQILKTLFENKYNRISKTKLARKLHMQISNVHVILDNLIEQGFVMVQRHNNGEGVMQSISLNSSGEEIASKLKL